MVLGEVWGRCDWSHGEVCLESLRKSNSGDRGGAHDRIFLAPTIGGECVGGGRLERFLRANFMNIQRVGVVGAGTMGNGIAHVFARGGYDVVLCDVEQRFLDRAVETIGKNLEREVAKNKITAMTKPRH